VAGELGHRRKHSFLTEINVTANFERFGVHMPLFFTFIFLLSNDTLQNITSHNLFYMMRQAFMSGAAVVSHGSHHIAVMRLGQVRFLHGIGGLKVTVSSEIFGLSPQLRLEPAPHTSEALAERYRNGSQLILGN
jgi:hypothetical protein